MDIIMMIIISYIVSCYVSHDMMHKKDKVDEYWGMGSIDDQE